MINTNHNKTLTAKTGKDIFNLLKSRDSAGSKNLNVLSLNGEIQNILFDFWTNLLPAQNFTVNNDFFAVGGNSIKAVQLASGLSRRFSIDIELVDIFSNPTIHQLSNLITERQKHVSVIPPLTPQERSRYIPLSFSQERLWFIHKLEGSVQYHIPEVLRLKGDVDIAGLHFVLKTIIDRHEVLRTVYLDNDGSPYQHVRESNNWNLAISDGPLYKEDNNGLEQYIQEWIAQPFNLSNDYMLRAALITLDPLEHILLINMHHIASDGWSMSVIVKEVIELYASFTEKRLPELPPIHVQFADYAIWQRNYLKGEVLDKKIAYWKNKLQDVKPLRLPKDYARSQVLSSQGALVNFSIGKELLIKLHALCQKQNATLYMTLLAVYKVLLYRYSGQEDICVATGIAGRQKKELDGLIGFFVNTLAMRSEVDGSSSFVDLLQKVKETTLEAYEYQDAPFEKVVDAIVGTRDLSTDPLVQVAFVLQNTPEVQQLKLGEVQLTAEEFRHNTTKFEIAVLIKEIGCSLSGVIEYSTDLYSRDTIKRMSEHFIELIQSIVQNPGQKISTIPMLTAKEEHRLLVDFNNTVAAYPKDLTFIDLFEEQVGETPNNVAAIYEGKQISYQQLNEQANQLAHFLQSKGVKAETLVPICIERGFGMITGILGILKAGGVYVPIDPEYPVERIRFMLEDTGADIVVTSRHTHTKLSGISNVEIIEIDEDRTELRNQPVHNLQISIEPRQLAYIIYTSGSTGKPKGVMIEHRGLVNLSFCQAKALQLKGGTKILQFASFTFDASCYEIFTALSIGAQLILCSKEEILSVDRLKNIINRYEVEVAVLPPTYQNILKGDLGTLQTIVSAGEPLDEAIGRYIQLKGIRLINAYGPTENTVCVSMTDSPIRDNHTIVIGKPIVNVQVYILDELNKLLPIGVIGEICIGGVQVARGYLNRAELTAEKFVKNPFIDEPGARMYKTGDLGRWLPDGNIEYLGRIDDQVKIRGYRIELGEIENVLQQSEQVQQAVVLAKENKDGDKKLLSYYVPDWQKVKVMEREYYQQQVTTWKDVYESDYGQTEGEADVDEEFNLIGWNDSFTGKAIETGPMQEWLDDIVRLILSKDVGRVLEIGCGTGLIFYRLAGKVEKYIGTDISMSAVNQIKSRISKGLRDYGITEFWVSPAHEVTLPEGEQVDTIILNSIVQYFPGEGYMDDVICRSISLLNGKGRIIIGDVRDNRLLKMFKVRLQMQKLQGTVNIEELNWAAEQELLKEEELCFSPDYFFRLQSLYPEITYVDISWKQCSYINELTLYRYNVILYVGIEREVIYPEWRKWEECSKQSIIELLTQGVDTIGLLNMNNPRLWKEKLINKVLEKKEISSLSKLLEVTEKEDTPTLSIWEILGAAEANGYYYRLLLNEDAFKVNVLIEKKRSENFIRNVYDEKNYKQSTFYTNIPTFREISPLLKKDIQLFLQECLPEYMIPKDIIALEKFPLTRNGKIDRRFLIQREDISLRNTLNYEPPATEIEQKLVSIWQELLHVEQVGIHDNFFELGGHSLMVIKLIASIKKVFLLSVPVPVIFQFPSIAKLSNYIEWEKNVEEEDLTSYEVINL